MQTTMSCNTEKQYITFLFQIHSERPLGSFSTVIASIVSGHKSVSVIFCNCSIFQIQPTCTLRINVVKDLFRYSFRPCD